MLHRLFILKPRANDAMVRVGLLEIDAYGSEAFTKQSLVILGIYRYLLVWGAPKSLARWWPRAPRWSTVTHASIPIAPRL